MTTGSDAQLAAEREGDWWNAFYTARSKPCPVFDLAFNAGSFDLVCDGKR